MKQRVVFSLYGNLKNCVLGVIFLFVSFLCSTMGTILSFYDSCYFAQVVQASSVYSEIGGGQAERSDNVLSSKFPDLKDLFEGFFGKSKKQVKDNRVIMVYPGGYPLGFTMECLGVVVISIGSVLTEVGMETPMDGKDIRVGDIIYSINGETIKSASHMQTLLNEIVENDIQLEIHRGSEIINETVTKVKELSTKMYRLGLWIRDNTAGVGTLTYVRQDNFRFGALGHPVCDIDTGKIMPVSGGSIYKCNIVGFNKGVRGNPGELRGLFLKTGLKVGVLDNNNNFGVYGIINSDYVEKMNVAPVQVGFRDSVKTGKATILSTIDGGQPEEYEIEIIKLSYQSSSDKKSMVIRITDERLLETTGGIVQGMSGSPILQNGKLIGAVTHVFVSDPTKGFGVYIDWMIDN